jgi:predicted phosphatase
MKTVCCVVFDEVEGPWKWSWSIGHIIAAFSWKSQGKNMKTLSQVYGCPSQDLNQAPPK